MLLAASFAGLALSQTRTTACHSISYPLTLNYSIDHGIACVMTLPDIMKINKQLILEISEIEDLFQKFEGIDNWLKSICGSYYKLNLSSYGVNKTDIPSIVDECYTKGRMDNNPVFINKNNLREILVNKL
jgi:alcohol dehydrogenase class IV